MTLPDDPVKTLLEWMRENLDKPLSVPDLAARLHVSPRTLTRRFSAATGLTPHQWLIRERLLLVQSLLERTDESVDRIARRCGFPSAATMRHLFRRELGSTPQTYRSAFRARQAAEAEAC
jgi:AraC family transcriptional activator FtrA